MVKIKTSKGNIPINQDNIVAIKSNSTGDGIEGGYRYDITNKRIGDI